MQNYVKFLKTTVLTLACLSLTGCIDDSYDLEDIDLTIGSNVDLTLPSSSTGVIALKNIMDVTDDGDGIVRIVDGEFYLQEDGSADIPQINIDSVAIPAPQIDEINTDVNINLNIPDWAPKREANAKLSAHKRVSIGGFEIEDDEFHYTIEDLSKTTFSVNAKSGQITKDVVALKEVRLKDETSLVVDISTTMKNGGEFFKLVHLDNLFINYPKGLNIKSVTCKHWSYRKNPETGENEEYLNEHEAANFDNDKGYLLLTTGGNVGIGVNKSIEITIEFDKVIFGDDKDLKFENNQILLDGMFQVGGSLHVETADLELIDGIQNEDERNELIKKFITLYLQGGLEAIIPQQISIKGNASFNEDIKISGFKGEILREVGDIAPIKLNDLPDFLNDPEVVLDLANPVIYVDVNNPLPADAKTQIILQSIYDNPAENVPIQTREITIYNGQRTVYCLAESFDETMKHPYENVKIEPVLVPGLNKLLKTIPKEIKVEIAPISMEIEDMQIPISYKVEVDYKIYTPLAFGKDFRLVYQGTETGWAADIDEDMEKIDAGEISLTAEAESNLPLDLNLTIELLDENGDKIEGLEISQMQTIEANSDGTDISFSIKAADGYSIKDFLSGEKGQKLDGVRYKAVASAQNSDVLKEDASIILRNIRVRIKGNVSYDAN